MFNKYSSLDILRGYLISHCGGNLPIFQMLILNENMDIVEAKYLKTGIIYAAEAMNQEFSKESKEMMINVLWNIVSSEQLEFIADDDFSFNSMISLTARLNRTDLFMKLSTFESFKKMKRGPM